MKKRKLPFLILLLIIISSTVAIVGCSKKQDSIIGTTHKQAVVDAEASSSTEKSIELPESIEQQISYKPYYDIVDKTILKYGVCVLDFQYSSGLAYAELLDFDADGINELYMLYLNNENENGQNSFVQEIWKLKDGIPTKIFSKDFYNYGLVFDLSVSIVKDDSKCYIMHSSSYSSGGGNEPYTNIAAMSNTYFTLENDDFVEVANVSEIYESTPDGTKERTRYTSGDSTNEIEISKEEYEDINSKFKSKEVKQIILGNSGCPSFAIDVSKNIEVFNNFLLNLDEDSNSYKNNSYAQITEDITQNIEHIFNNIQGNYSVAFKDINESDELLINNSRVPAASVIKIYIIIEAYNQVQQGKLLLNDKITIDDSMKVGGSGKVQNEPNGTQFNIEELIRLMMVESDNTAANILIDKLGMDNINNTVKSLGCADTELNRKMMDMDALNRGIDNYTSVNDLCSTLDKLYNGECVNSEYDNKILDIMKGHQLKSKIPNKLPEGTVVAHKSGEMGGIENDAAIVYTDKGAYILCILTNNGTSNEQVIAISDISKEIYDKYMEYKGD